MRPHSSRERSDAPRFFGDALDAVLARMIVFRVVLINAKGGVEVEDFGPTEMGIFKKYLEGLRRSLEGPSILSLSVLVQTPEEWKHLFSAIRVDDAWQVSSTNGLTVREKTEGRL